MRVSSFMKLVTETTAVAGPSTSDSHAEEIELLSFEHAIERTPTRTDAAFHLQTRLNRHRLRRQAAGSNAELIHRRTLEDEQVANVALASTLRHQPVTAYKLVDESSNALYKQATKTTLLTSVILSARTMVKVGTVWQAKDFLSLVLKDAFISDMRVVGAYPLQPWLGINSEIWASRSGVDLGPVERVEISYNKIEWSVNEQEKFKWNIREASQNTS